MTARRFDWSYEALLLLLLGAETAVVYLATEATFYPDVGPDGKASPLVVFAILFIGTQLQRWLEAHYILSPTYELVTVAALSLTLLGALYALAFPHYAPWNVAWLVEAGRAFALLPSNAARPVWEVVALVAYAWWRGRSRDEAGLDAAYRLLRFGVAASAALLLVEAARLPAASNQDHWRAIYATVVAFFLCALNAIALARLRVEQARGTLTLTPRWLATFLWPTVALLVGGMLLTGLFTRRFLDTLLWLLTPFFALAQLLLLLLIYIATGVAFVAIAIFSWLLARLGPVNVTPTPATPMARATPSPSPFEGVQPVHVPDPLRYLLALALLAAIVWLLTRFLWRRRPRAALPASETRESVFSWRLVGESAARLLARRRARRGADPLAHLRDDPRWRYTLAIREVYTLLLRRGAAANAPRQPDATPDEYQATLGARFQPARPPLARLTELYDVARYGDRPATADEAAAARAAWEEVHAASNQTRVKKDRP